MDKSQSPPPYSYQPQPPYNNYPPPPQSQPPYNYPPPPQQQLPSPSTTNVTQINLSTQPTYGGTCPVCHVGTFSGSFTLCGWLCCLFCFPCGIICCLCMRKKKCNHCGFSTS